MRMILIALAAVMITFSASSAMAEALVPEFSCLVGYTFVPELGVISNGLQMGYCKSSAQMKKGCSSAPTVAITEYSPEEIWARNSKFVSIMIRGRIGLPENCTMEDANYLIVDEYGNAHASGMLDVRGGLFTAVAPVMVSHKDSEAYGRLYRIIVEARDEYGKGTSAPASVTVTRRDS